MAKQAQPNIEMIAGVTCPGITMYPWVFEPNKEPDDQGNYWYQIMLKFPKDKVEDGGEFEEDFNEMRRNFAKAAKEGIRTGMYSFTSMSDRPDDFGNPIRDGDKFDRQNNKKRKEELRGHYYVNFKSKAESDPPEVTDAQNGLTTITSRKDFYPGCWAVVSYICGPYENKGNEGVYTRLTNVCKIKDDKRIGGKPAAKEQFSKYGKNAPKRNRADEDEDDLM